MGNEILLSAMPTVGYLEYSDEKGENNEDL
jgi:hypothetical protein